MPIPAIESATVSFSVALKKATVRAYRSMAPIYVYAVSSPELGASIYYAATFQAENGYALTALRTYLPDAARRRVQNSPLTIRLVAEIRAHNTSYEAR